MDNISALIPTSTQREKIASILKTLPNGFVQTLHDGGCKIHALERNERYDAASPALARLGIDVDAWPAPPAGLFVVEERTVYLRSCSPMTVVHECAHALDCALGGGVYLSGKDAAIRAAFLAAKRFVTPYAATGLDEYFAECVRAYVGANDAASHWPRATKGRLLRCDPTMYAIVGRIFAGFATATTGEQIAMVLR